MNLEYHLRNLTRFGKQTPDILRNQYLSVLIANNFSLKKNDGASEIESGNGLNSMERFHCSLLLVDISGFTILSQALVLDDLKTHINQYFKMILDIISKHNGEVVKFAGDALFVIWQSNISYSENDYSYIPDGKSVEKAVECGLEINAICSNYKISISRSDSVLATKLRKTVETDASDHNLASFENIGRSRTYTLPDSDLDDKSKSFSNEENLVYYLNVHSAVSTGVMAGVDVGLNDRWEYFIIGDPIEEVAVALGESGCGELVIGGKAIYLLLGIKGPVSGDSTSTLDGMLHKDNECNVGNTLFTCEYIFTDIGNGLYKICHKMKQEFNSEESLCQLLKIDSEDEDGSRAHDRLLTTLTNCFCYVQLPSLTCHQHPLHTSGASCDGSGSLGGNHDLIGMDKDIMQQYYLDFCQRMILDQLYRHTHEAERGSGNLDFKSMEHLTFLKYLDEQEQLQADRSPSSSRMKQKHEMSHQSLKLKNLVSMFVSEDSSESDNQNEVELSEQEIRQGEVPASDSSASASASARRDRSVRRRGSASGLQGHLTAELREIITIFININFEQKLNLYFDAPSEDSHRGYYRPLSLLNFLPRSKAEYESDSSVLSHYQICVSTIVRILTDRGGQLRQFMVDDKGTVCIGTFGLRGSVHEDNAAAAVDASHNIILELLAFQINASIGITGGKVYCGLVGSSDRYEYAVMGPSVNLAARLMSKAKPGEIICDKEIRNDDRVHLFSFLASVKAKGYSEPVPIYQPIFPNSSQSLLRHQPVAMRAKSRQHRRSTAALSRRNSLTTAAASLPHKMTLVGISDDFKTIFRFLFSAYFVHSSDAKLQNELMDALEREEYDDSLLHQLNTTTRVFQTSKGDDVGESCMCRAVEGLQRSDRAGTEIDHAQALIHDRDINDRGSGSGSSHHSKLVVIHGVSGTGKSSLLNLFRDSFTLSSTFPFFNVSIFYSKCSDMNFMEPFFVWKTIFQQLFHKVSITQHVSSEHDDPQSSSSIDSGSGSGSSGLSYLDDVIHLFLQGMSVDCLNLYPLLSLVGITDSKQDTAETARLTGEARVTATAELLGELLEHYLKISERIIFIIIDDLHAIDRASQQLVNYLITHTHGISILCSSSSSTSSSNPSATKPAARNSTTAAARNYGIELMKAMEIFAGSKYKEIEVLPLSLKNTSLLTDDLLHRDHIHGVCDEATYAKIFELSKGIPVYIHKLVSLAIHRYYQRDEAEAASSFSEIIRQLRPQRFEAVVCHRFDQLGEKQRIVLKMASIAAFRGQIFTVKLLSFMFQNSKSAMDLLRTKGEGGTPKHTPLKSVGSREDKTAKLLESFDVVEAIYSLLEINEFIRISLQASKRLSLADIDLTVVDLETAHLEFKNSVAHKTIYELMLEEQRTTFHSLVAAFLEEYISLSSIVSYDYYNQIASHYQLAKVYPKAMLWHYRSAALLDAAGAYKESKQNLIESYVMYEMMRREAGLVEHTEAVLPSFRSLLLYSATTIVEETSDNEGSLQRTPSAAKLNLITKEKLSHLFGNDSHLLDAALHMLIKLGQICLTQGDDSMVTASLYEMAFQLITASSANTSAKQEGDVDVGGGELRLGDTSFLFPILSGIILQYRVGHLRDDEWRTKENEVCSLFLAITRSSEDCIVHNIVARYTKANIYYSNSQFREAIDIIDSICDCYDAAPHSPQLVKIYGSDRVLAYIASNAAAQLLVGDLEAAEKSILFVQRRMMLLTHVTSMSVTALSLCNVLVMMNRFQEATTWFDKFLEFETNSGGFNLFSCYKGLFCAWLEIHLPDRETAVSIPEELESNIVSKAYMTPMTGRSMVQIGFLAYSRGIDNVCAELCLHRGTRLSPYSMSEESALQYLKLAEEYVNNAIACNKVSSDAISSYFQSLFLKLRILKKICDINTDTTHQESNSMALRDCLQNCIELARKAQCWYPLLFAGEFSLQLDEGSEQGRLLMTEGLKLSCNAIITAQLFEKWKILFPFLSVTV